MKLASWAFAFDAILVSFMARQPPCLVCFASRYSTEKRRAVAALFPAIGQTLSKMGKLQAISACIFAAGSV
jgi:hypothetical protein